MTKQNLMTVAGSTFVVSNAMGDIEPTEQHGVFAADTRFLSGLRLRLGDLHLTLLRSGPAGFAQSQIYLTNRASEGLAAQDLEVIRQRRLRRTGLTETIECTNHGSSDAVFPLQLWVDTDFADIFEVRSVETRTRRRHTRIKTESDSITFFDTVRANQRLTRVSFSNVPETIESGHATFSLTLKPRQQWALVVDVEWTVPIPESTRPVPVAKDIGNESALEWIESVPVLITDDDMLARAYERSVRDLAALEIALNSGYPIPAAGLPWYLAIFGRDSVITSLQTMLLNQRHALGTLRTLASYQAQEDNAFRDAEPGKMAHEIRFGELAISETLPHSRYYGSVDSTPLWLMLFSEYQNWVEDSLLLDELLPAAERALEWIDRHGDLDGDGFIEYARRSSSGLVNQGWKDSWDSVRFSDGRIAEPPIALVEAQGYVYSARLGMAAIYDRIGCAEKAAEQRAKAEYLKEAVQAAFWMPDQGYFAMALDGRKRQVDSITSNPGHLLWSGLPDDGMAQQIVERIMAPDMFSGWGIRTMSSEMYGYNPISYHNGTVWPHDNSLIIAGMQRYGHSDQARQAADGLLDAAQVFTLQRLPELFCGFERRQTPFPVDYPVACSPQAWAAGTIVQLIQICLGLSTTSEDLSAQPISDRVSGLTNVKYRGRRYDIDGDQVVSAPAANNTALESDS